MLGMDICQGDMDNYLLASWNLLLHNMIIDIFIIIIRLTVTGRIE